MANDVTLTEERIKNFKYILYACLGLAIAVDFVIFVVLAVYALPVKYWIVPMLLAIVDIAFFILSFFLNFRFRYSIPYVIVYACAAAALTIAAFTVGSDLGSGTAFTAAAHVLWAVVHIIMIAVVPASAALSAKNGSNVKILSAVLGAALVIVLGVYGGFLIGNGYFGQGRGEQSRVVVYRLDEASDTYIAVGAESGRSDTVVVPAEFDGKRVGAIDCALFATPGIATVRLDCDAAVRFDNLDALDGITPPRITARKDDLDIFREFFYTKNKLDCARSIEPSDLGDGEVFVTFDYEDSYSDVGSARLKTWFGNKNDVLTLSDAPEWYAHADAENDGDLHIAYTARNRLIFDGFLDGDGNDINGAKLERSYKNATVKFAEVYAVTVCDDNDESYEAPESFKSAVIDGNPLGYRYTTAKNANKLLASAPARDGFSLIWQRPGGAKIDDLSVVLTANGKPTFSIYPIWELNKPTVGDIAVTAKNATYGDSVDFSSEVNSPAENIDLKYTWYLNDVILPYDKNSFTDGLIDMDEAGTYKLAVTAYSIDNAVTSLSSVETKTVEVSVAKRQLGFSWETDANDVYNGLDKKVTASYDETRVVAGDTITFAQSFTSVKNVGPYELDVTLLGDCANKYEPVGNTTYTVKPAPLTIEVGEVRKTYDRKPFSISEFSYKATGLVNGETLGAPTFTCAALDNYNAGVYAISVSFPSSSSILSNYKISNVEGAAVIEPKHIRLGCDYDEAHPFVYDGKPHAPVITAEDGMIAEGDDLGSLLSVPQGNIDVGNYLFTAALVSDNYTLGASNKIEVVYEIIPKDVTYVWDSASVFVYDGKEHGRVLSRIDGIVSRDLSDYMSHVTYTGGGVHAVTDATVTAEFDMQNYRVTGGKTALYTILKRTVSAKWYSVTDFTYDGKPHCAEVVGIENVVDGERTAVIDSLIYSGERTAVGTNAVSVTLPENSDYVFDGAQTSQVTVSSAPLTIYPNGFYKEYNGKPFTEDMMGYTAVGLVEGETLKSPCYTYPATKNAGTYSYSIEFTSEEDRATLANYTVTNYPGNLEIRPKKVEPVWNASVFTYDGTEHTLTLSGLIGLVDGDSAASELSNVVYTKNTLTDVGTVTVTASMKSGSNYILGENNSVTKVLEVKEREVTFVWSSGTYVYNGLPQGPAVTKAESADDPSNDWLSEIGEISYDHGTNAGEHTAVAHISNINFRVASGETFVYNIAKKPVTVSFDTADGSELSVGSPAPVASTGVGIECRVYYTGTGIDGATYTAPTAPGTYTAHAEIANENYTASGETQITYTVKAQEAA